MTTDQLLSAFVSAGFDTPEKVSGLLSMAGAQMKRNALLIKLEGLKEKRATATAEINAEQSTIQSNIDALTAHITAAAQG